MADVKVHFNHPTDGRQLTVDLDDSITAAEAISELIGAEFIPSNPDGYNLAIKGGAQLSGTETFSQAGVETGTNLRILPATDAGFIQ